MGGSRSPRGSSFTLPARPPPSMPAHPPANTGQPGLMKQMAATAGGVAMGSVVGHAVTGALSGGGHNGPTSQPQYDNGRSLNPCQYQIDDLINCAQTQNDISFCASFSESLKECNRKYANYMS